VARATAAFRCGIAAPGLPEDTRGGHFVPLYLLSHECLSGIGHYEVENGLLCAFSVANPVGPAGLDRFARRPLTPYRVERVRFRYASNISRACGAAAS
jgi:hypothetical protein